MLRYTLRRFEHATIVVFGVSTIVFLMLHLSGDPIQYLLGSEAADSEIARLRSDWGLDQPAYVQYFRFLEHAIHGNFGASIRLQQPALALVLERLPATIVLTIAATILAVGLAIPLGIIAAIHRRNTSDHFVMGITLVGQSLPSFWLGIMLILIFPVRLGVLYTGGWSGPLGVGHLLLPGITLASFSGARLTRLIRSAVIRVLQEDYIRTAYAKGILRRTVLLKHALRNALLPVITVIGLDFGALLGGATVTETIFAYPGVGRLVMDSIIGRDYPIVQATVVIVAVLFTAVNLLVDLLYALVDPRIRYE